MLKEVALILNILLFVDTKLIPLKNEGNQLQARIPIEQNSWFETQMSGSGLSRINDNLGDIMVFDGGTWNSYPACQGCGKFQTYRPSCVNKAEYLNLCGECVGGTSEKEDDYGLDSCGICGGFERCDQNSCENDNEEFRTHKNCKKVVGIRPKVMDIANSLKGVIHLIGNIDENQLECSIYSETSELGKVKVLESPVGLEFVFELPRKEGRLDMHCNSTDGPALMNSFLVVDSRKLQPLASDVQVIEFGKESKITLTVGNMYALADVLCFAKDEDGNVVYKTWSNEIQGNRLSSQVGCSRIWPQKQGKLKFGAAFSEDAVKLAKTLDLNVIIAEDLTLLRASLLKDKLTLYFNHALSTYTECKDMFKTVSNKEAKCWSTGNEIRVQFKDIPNLKIGYKLDVIAASASTGLPESFSIKIDGPQMSESLSNLEIKGPEVVCIGQKASFEIDGSAVKWSLTLPEASVDDPNLTSGNRQRKNMMLWRGLREAGKALKNEGAASRVSLNSSLLPPGIEYQIKATLHDGSTRGNTFTKNFQVVSDSNGQPVIKGPNRLSWTHDALYEVENQICDANKTADLRYEWTIGDSKQSLIQQPGPKMRVRAGTLESNSKYNLTVRLLNNAEVLNEAMMEVVTQPAQLKIATYVDEIVYGTGHRVVLSGNSEIVPARTTIGYHWSCQSGMGPCLMPGQEQKPIETLRGFDDSVLLLPPGSLPVGKYSFTLNISLPSGESTSRTTRVLIVPGEPTLLSLDSLDFDGSLKVVMQAKDIIGECSLALESLKSTNSSFLDLNELAEPQKVKGTPQNPESKTILLEVPLEKLIYGSSYLLRLTADCGALSQSWLTFTVPIPEKSATCELDVTPDTGTALSTEFYFRATNCYPINPIYSYGFSLDGTEYYLSSSLSPQQTLFSFPGEVKPVMKICEYDKICGVHYGRSMSVKPSEIHPTAKSSVLKDFADNLLSGHYTEVLGTTKLLLETCKEDSETLKNVSDSITQILIQRIHDVSKQLDSNEKAEHDVLTLLHCAMEVIKSVDASDEVITVILEFRDKIEDKLQHSDDQYDVETEERRVKRSDPRIKKRQTGSAYKQVLYNLSADEYGVLLKDTAIRINRTARFLNSLTNYAITLCKSIKPAGKPLHIGNKITEMGVMRTSISGSTKNVIMPAVETNQFKNSSAKIYLSKAFLELYDTNNDLCLGMNYFKEDFYSLISNATSEWNITRWSGVYKSHLYQYRGDKLLNNTRKSNNEAMASISIPIWDTPVPSGTNLTCHLWKDGVGWHQDSCITVKTVKIHNVQAIECNCPFPGIYGIFAASKPAAVSTTSGQVSMGNSTTPPPPVTTGVETTTQSPTSAPPPKTTVPLAVPSSTMMTTTNTTVTNGTTVSAMTTTTQITTTTSQATTTFVATAVTTKAPLTSSTLIPVIPADVTTMASTSKPEDYNVAAAFLIDEKYNETVGSKKKEFADKVKSQLTKTVFHDDINVDAPENNGKIKIIVRLRYSDKSELPKLQQMLASGEFKLEGLNNTQLKVPPQRLEIFLGPRDSRSSTFAVISTAIFISLAFILAVLFSGMFLKWKRQQRALNFVQNMEISAPKYLRLQETSSMDRIDRSYGSTDNLRSGDLDSGIVLTVDPTRISSKYQPAGDGSRNAMA